jgi:DNA-binding IclR family transcriptional regulator
VDLTDDQYELADAIERVLEPAPAGGMTPSAIARKARATTSATATVLGWLVEHRYAHTSGNGAWRHYHWGRAS